MKLLSTVLALLCLPLLAFAQQKYEPLILIPGLTDGGGGSFSAYINFLYGLAIAIAALIAVIKIIVAGVKYMLSASVGKKGDAKGEIKSALLGLLLILGAYIILNTINPTLTKTSVIFGDLPADPKLLSNDSVKAAQTQTPAERLSSPTLACVKRSTGTSGGFKTYGIDVSTCGTVMDTGKILTQFREDCGVLQGTLRTTPTGGGCAVPVKPTSPSGTLTPPKTTATPQTKQQICSSSGGLYTPAVGVISKESCSGGTVTRERCDAFGGIYTAPSSLNNFKPSCTS